MITDLTIITGANKSTKAKELAPDALVVTPGEITATGFKIFFDNQSVIIDEVTKSEVWLVDNILNIEKLSCKLIVVSQEKLKFSRAKYIECN